MTYYERIILEFDGASRSNPHGPAGCGYVLYEMNWDGSKGSFIIEGSQYLGYNVSNNQAEYQGLINGLAYVSDYLSCHGLYVRGDSQIVINQMNGDYAVRSNNIWPYYNEATDVLADVDLSFYKLQHIDRNSNWEADQLANDAIDYQ
eukprot:CAMPEP_0204613818 /NCGR_PEP_ID=MMETSP0717-20131115/1743_1 /ASSEMBLY_ACC=CAM_ASM_000666 /TAXON_ID=230516 /ORGANISM="Chaetoceros curvisetus" /LENGTH=146 /DNA_ID=CAMNT_0051626371 /DNA_START=460 /DNA_END=900 /DNA_ORIENTATION=-